MIASKYNTLYILFIWITLIPYRLISYNQIQQFLAHAMTIMINMYHCSTQMVVNNYYEYHTI